MPEIAVSRLIHAPRRIVFDAFSDPAGLAQWFGPNGFRTATHEMDFREGGHWRYTMHGPDGTDYPNFVRYTMTVPGEKLAYDHGTYAHLPAEFQAEISFADEGGGTRVSLRLILASDHQYREKVKMGAIEGAEQTLGRLASRMEQLTTGKRS